LTCADFLNYLIIGIAMGAMYALIALGYSMVYGIIKLINFAHGEIVMMGGFAGYVVYASLSPRLPMPLVLAAMFFGSAIFTSILGFTIEKLAYRPLRNSPRLTALLAALGVSIFLQNFVAHFAPQDKPFPNLGEFFNREGASAQAIRVSEGISIPHIYIFIAVTSIVLMLLLDLFVKKARMGKAMRAVSQDMGAARMMGINVDSVISITFIIGSALAAIAGVMYGLIMNSIGFTMGFLIGIKAFAAAVIGGIGNVRGTMIGGFIIGISENVIPAMLFCAGLPETVYGYNDVVAFVILIIVLMFRPAGLFGKVEVERP
jgi:branched-chain amino acid transport system permease protein